MELISVEYLQEHFEEILDDIEKNKTHYQVNTPEGSFVLIPCTSFDLLCDTYKLWVEDVEPVEEEYEN